MEKKEVLLDKRYSYHRGNEDGAILAAAKYARDSGIPWYVFGTYSGYTVSADKKSAELCSTYIEVGPDRKITQYEKDFSKENIVWIEVQSTHIRPEFLEKSVKEEKEKKMRKTSDVGALATAFLDKGVGMAELLEAGRAGATAEKESLIIAPGRREGNDFIVFISAISPAEAAGVRDELADYFDEEYEDATVQQGANDEELEVHIPARELPLGSQDEAGAFACVFDFLSPRYDIE